MSIFLFKYLTWFSPLVLLWLLAWPRSLMIASSAGSTRKRRSNWYYLCQWSRIPWRWTWNMSGQNVSSTRSSTEGPLCREVNRRRVVKIRFQLDRRLPESICCLSLQLAPQSEEKFQYMNNSRRTSLWGCSSSLSLLEYIIFCAYYYSISFFGRSGVLIFLRSLVRAEHLLSGKKCLGFVVGWLVGCLGHISRVINSPFYIYLSSLPPSFAGGMGWGLRVDQSSERRCGVWHFRGYSCSFQFVLILLSKKGYPLFRFLSSLWVIVFYFLFFPSFCFLTIRSVYCFFVCLSSVG